jgi:hypothetical protein
MVGSVGSSGAPSPDATIYQRKVLPPRGDVKAAPGSVYKPRIGGSGPPELAEHIKQMSAAAKGAQAQYDAMAKQLAEMTGPPSEQLIALRQWYGRDQPGKVADTAKSDPTPALFVDTKA